MQRARCMQEGHFCSNHHSSCNCPLYENGPCACSRGKGPIGGPAAIFDVLNGLLIGEASLMLIGAASSSQNCRLHRVQRPDGCIGQSVYKCTSPGAIIIIFQQASPEKTEAIFNRRMRSVACSSCMHKQHISSFASKFHSLRSSSSLSTIAFRLSICLSASAQHPPVENL